jgi:hypothetical protein
MYENQGKIIGSWKDVNGRVVADENCDIIERIISEKLVYLADDKSGWNKLYINNIDKSLWELTYPEGDLQGGGPPTLTRVKKDNYIKDI